MFKNILIVCTGNICRSPMAAELLRSVTAPRDLTITSAGIGAMVGQPADPLAIEVMRENGANIESHRAQQLTSGALKHSDLILVADQGHARWISSSYPQFSSKVLKIGYWNKNVDVADPYRQPKINFEAAYGEMKAHVIEWARHL